MSVKIRQITPFRYDFVFNQLYASLLNLLDLRVSYNDSRADLVF